MSLSSRAAGAGFRLLALVLAWGLGGSAAAAAPPWVNGQAATVVLGQDDFTTSGSGTTAARFSHPTGVCADALTGKLFVVDSTNSRVLRFSSGQSTTIGGQAEAVFGQPDFTSNDINHGGLSAKSLWHPTNCVVSPDGRLFVLDSGNQRVLRYDNAASKGNFAAADGVLGQPDFVSTPLLSIAANRLGFATNFGITLDRNGALYVGDNGNFRVLRFDDATSKPNGALPNGVLGAPDLTTSGEVTGVTASNFGDSVRGLATDASGNLYVNDVRNRRILRFDDAASKENGAPADGVLGAENLTTAGSGTSPTRSNMIGVYQLEVAPDGALYAVDLGFRRVLVYNDPASKSDGAEADYVLGQPDFTSQAPATSATGLTLPMGLAYNAYTGYLMVADFNDNRVVGYRPPPANQAPAASGVTVTGATQVGQALAGSYTYADAENDPEGATTFQWKRGAQAILGATGLHYTPVSADVSWQLAFCVTPRASTGTQDGAETCSAPTSMVSPASVDGECGNAANQPWATVPSADLCDAGTPGAVSSAGGHYAWQCQGAHGGGAASCQAPWANAGSGSATVVPLPANGWHVDSASVSPTPPAGVAAPPNVIFPAGLLTLNLSSGAQGSDATVTLQFTRPIPSGAVYMKYGPSPAGFNCQGATACAQPHWYEMPASRVVIASDRLSATLTLTDGGLGDGDGRADTFILDPGGFALLAAPAQSVPTLGEWGVLLLSALAAAFGVRAVRRQALLKR
ncbi:MAG: IPTL-CTERM sorting domain-containing protein [Acidovorax sp.]